MSILLFVANSLQDLFRLAWYIQPRPLCYSQTVPLMSQWLIKVWLVNQVQNELFSDGYF